jgi:hypothetical protein
LHLRLLRLFLGFAALAWGVSAVGVFASWSEAATLLEGLGAKPIAYDPMLDYWLRMASGAFALVGVWYLVLMIWPGKFHAAIPWFGALMLVEGLILLVHGLRFAAVPILRRHRRLFHRWRWNTFLFPPRETAELNHGARLCPAERDQPQQLRKDWPAEIRLMLQSFSNCCGWSPTQPRSIPIISTNFLEFANPARFMDSVRRFFTGTL